MHGIDKPFVAFCALQPLEYKEPQLTTILVSDNLPIHHGGYIRSSGGPNKDAQHVLRIDRSGKQQFTAIEEEVIGLNESRIVYNRFVKEVLVHVPKRSRKLAARVAFLYQRAITVNMVKRAVLCVAAVLRGLAMVEAAKVVGLRRRPQRLLLRAAL